MIFDKLGRIIKINADFKKKKMRNRRYGNGKAFKFFSVFTIISIVFPMLVGCGQVNGDKTMPETALETTMEETKDAVSAEATSIPDMEAVSSSTIRELTAEGYGGLYSGSWQGRYYYVWLEKGSSTSIESPVGTIRLLWEGSEPYAEGNELSQDAPHNFYRGNVDDGYRIKPGWNNENSSILTIDADEFGKYSGKIFCFGFWMNKDDSLIYDGKSLRHRN